MVSAVKLIFVAVAVICYMQTAEMTPVPDDNAQAPALPANLMENLSNPEFWKSITQNVQNSLGEENLKKMGINTEEMASVISNLAGEFQKNVAKVFEQPAAGAKA